MYNVKAYFSMGNFGRGVNLWLFKESSPGNLTEVAVPLPPVEFRALAPQEYGATIPPLLYLPVDAQEIMRAASFNRGGPTQDTLKGQLEAQTAHLHDLQAILRRRKVL